MQGALAKQGCRKEGVAFLVLLGRLARAGAGGADLDPRTMRAHEVGEAWGERGGVSSPQHSGLGACWPTHTTQRGTLGASRLPNKGGGRRRGRAGKQLLPLFKSHHAGQRLEGAWSWSIQPARGHSCTPT